MKSTGEEGSREGVWVEVQSHPPPPAVVGCVNSTGGSWIDMKSVDHTNQVLTEPRVALLGKLKNLVLVQGQLIPSTFVDLQRRK